MYPHISIKIRVHFILLNDYTGRFRDHSVGCIFEVSTVIVYGYDYSTMLAKVQTECARIITREFTRGNQAAGYIRSRG